MKRTYSITILFFLSFTFAISARDFSYTYEGQTLTYSIIDEDAKTCMTKPGAAFVAANNITGDLIIPEKATDANGNTYSVISIGDYSFSNCPNLTSVVIPESVTIIGIGAFLDCGITSVVIPPSVSFFGSSAFGFCSSLNSIYISDIASWCNMNIQSNAANPLDNIANLYLNNELITDLIIPEGITNIGRFAFGGCRSIKSVTLPSTVVSIGTAAFKNCYNLQRINIPKSLKHIDYSVFEKCTSLTSVQIEDLTSWCEINFSATSNPLCNGASLYLNSQLVDTLEIPSSVSRVLPYSFTGCSSLKSVIIPNSTIEIDERAFFNCKELSSITIGSNVERIGKLSFAECPKLSNIYCYSSLPPEIDGCTFTNFADISLFVPKEAIEGYQTSNFWKDFEYIKSNDSQSAFTPKEFSVGYFTFRSISNNECQVIGTLQHDDVVIPDTINYDGVRYTITSIATNAFSKNWHINSITLPNTITVIGGYAFKDCNFLESVTLPNSLKRIEGEAFMNCQNLTTIDIPNSVTYIGPGAFDNCTKLSSVSLPDNLSTISPYTFEGCESLEEIFIPKSIKAVGERAFLGSGIKNVNISSLKDWCEIEFQPSSNPLSGSWITGGSRLLLNGIELTTLNIPEGITILKPYSFNYCSSIKKVILPQTLSEIQDYAFQRCENMEAIELPNSLNTIGLAAFWYCSSLRTVEFPNSLDSIGMGAFMQCHSLKEIELPDNIRSIGRKAFEDCSSLESVRLPEYLNTVCETILAGCSSLKSIEIPEGVEIIERLAFFDCNSLIEITLPGSLKHIGEMAFGYCTDLKKVYMTNPIPANIDITSFEETSNVTVYVPNGSKEVYSSNQNWSKVGTFETWNSGSNINFSSNSVSYHVTSDIYSTVEVSSVYVMRSRTDANNLIIPENITYNKTYQVVGIANNGMANSNVSMVELPASINYIGLNAFKGVSTLSSIRCLSKTPPSVDISSFEKEVYSKAVLEVPQEALDLYRDHDVWGLFTIKVISPNPSSINGVITNASEEVRTEGGDILIDCDTIANIYNISGKLVASTCNGRVSGLPKGIYIIHLKDKVYKISL